MAQWLLPLGCWGLLREPFIFLGSDFKFIYTEHTHTHFEWHSVIEIAQLEKVSYVHTHGGAPCRLFMVIKQKLSNKL